MLVDFWTYTCINCLRTLPHLEAWDRAYRRDGLTIVGVHSPEFTFERDAGNVAAAIRREGIRYPVAQDNKLATWDAYGNQYWPAEYLIDARGHVRHVDVRGGRLRQDRGGDPHAAARGRDGAAGRRVAPRPLVRPGRAGHAGDLPRARPRRGLRRAAARRAPRATCRRAPDRIAPNRFSLGGTWTLSQESARAGAGATLAGHVTGKDVYLVLSPPNGGRAACRCCSTAGRSRPRRPARDVHGGRVQVDRQRLYHLVSRPGVETHVLTLRFSPGVAGYAFTFG